MKLSLSASTLRTLSWLMRIIAILLLSFVFHYLYTRGISPVWAGVAIVCCRGLLRVLYFLASIVVSVAILVAILSFIII